MSSIYIAINCYNGLMVVSALGLLAMPRAELILKGLDLGLTARPMYHLGAYLIMLETSSSLTWIFYFNIIIIVEVKKMKRRSCTLI